MNAMRLSVIVWNEFIEERRDPASRAAYPEGLHTVIASALKSAPRFNPSAAPMEVTTATQNQPDHGLGEARLSKCDVLIWRGNLAQDEVSDEVVGRIHRRVLEGMGLIVLNSGDASKIFRKLLGTHGAPQSKATGENERLWVADPLHPIAAGLGKTFELPGERMYWGSSDIARPDSTVFISGFAGGEVFCSGCCWERGYGRLFYFRPGELCHPTFHDTNVQRILANAVRWAAPRFRFNDSLEDVHESALADQERPLDCPSGAVRTPRSRPYVIARTSPGNEGKRRSGAGDDASLGATTEPQPLFPTLISHLKEHGGDPEAAGKLGSGFKRTRVA